jgi:hypothetical protein
MVLPVLSLAVARVLYDFLCTGPHTSDLHSGKQPYSSQSITERSIKRERDAIIGSGQSGNPLEQRSS